MPRITDLANEDCVKQLRKFLKRAYQSAHINFLIGSGASVPAIETAGNVEKLISCLYEQKKEPEANLQKSIFIQKVQDPTNLLMEKETNPNNEIDETLRNYVRFLELVTTVLNKRKSSLVPKRANVFTSNYDLFIEKAGEYVHNVILNDGFNRSPDLSMLYRFSPENFFNSTFNTGNLYNYNAEIPTINLVKIHGSLSWEKFKMEVNGDEDAKEIVFKPRIIRGTDHNATNGQVLEYLDNFALVLPESRKFQTTVIDRFHYDLLRIYANSLELENSLLLVFGFSFEDEHILDVTKRALRNASLTVVVFAYDAKSQSKFESKFSGFDNVRIVAPSGQDKIEFDKFLEFLDMRQEQNGDI